MKTNITIISRYAKRKAPSIAGGSAEEIRQSRLMTGTTACAFRREVP